VDLCALLAGGWVKGEARNLLSPRTVRTPQAGLGGRLALERRIGAQLSARVHLDGLAWLTQTRLLVGDEPVWSSPPGDAAIGISLIKRLW
jgi:hypothetical protein